MAYFDPMKEAQQKCQEGKDNPFFTKYFISSNIGKSYFVILLLFLMESFLSFAEMFCVLFSMNTKNIGRESHMMLDNLL